MKITKIAFDFSHSSQVDVGNVVDLHFAIIVTESDERTVTRHVAREARALHAAELVHQGILSVVFEAERLRRNIIGAGGNDHPSVGYELNRIKRSIHGLARSRFAPVDLAERLGQITKVPQLDTLASSATARNHSPQICVHID